MGKPKISVALCTYNGEKYLAQQLDSILVQTITPFELVIADDCSTDGTLDLIKKKSEETSIPVRLLRSKSNVGVKANFEKAISECSGEYIALADQDDIWQRDKLQIFAQAILDSDRSVPTLFYADPALIGSSGEELQGSFLSRARIEPPVVDYWKLLATRNFAPGCCTVFDRTMVKQLLPFPEQAIIHDWWINLLFSLGGRICRVDSQTMMYRLHAGNNQGIGTHGRALKAGSSVGFLRLGSDNLLVEIRQLGSALARLHKESVPYPAQVDQLAALFDRGRMERPYVLMRLGITRGNALKTLLMMVASMFVTEKQICDDTISYQ
jgi:glycosyltransferase involved in cell wall biosynthesis